MCNPAVIVAATVGASAISAYGQIQAGQAAKQAGDYNAAIARNNQIIAERAAVDAETRGDIAADEQRRKTARVAGAQRAAFGASGLAIDSAYSTDILGDTAAFGELDALTIKSNAQREAYGYRVQGMNYAAEEAMARVGGKNANAAAQISAASTLIGGAASGGDRWMTYNRPSAGPTVAQARSNAGPRGGP
jgi:hypothetical protein